jgi:hypothetical protein
VPPDNLQHANTKRHATEFRWDRTVATELRSGLCKIVFERLRFYKHLLLCPLWHNPCFLAFVIKRNIRRDSVLQTTFDPRLDQHEIFEIDRSNLVLHLRTIRRAINESAEEVGMVAIENVFVKSVSRALTRTAQGLYLVAEDLDDLLRLVERARAPESTGRPELKRKSRKST